MFLSVSGDFSFSHSFLKYLQGKTRCWHLDFSSSCSWEETLGIISQLLWRGVTQAMPGYFLQSYLFFLRKKKSSCGRLWQNAFHNSLFSHVSAPFGLLQVLCVPLGGFGLFFLLLNLICPIWHWVVFPVCYWLKPLGLWWWFLKNHPIKKLSV